MLEKQIELARLLEDGERTLELTTELRQAAPEPANPQLVALSEMVGRSLAGDAPGARQTADAFRESLAEMPLTAARQRRSDVQIDGILGWASGDLETAVPNLQTALELMPTADLSDEGLSMRFILAESLWLAGRKEEAAREFGAVEDASMPRVGNPIVWLRALNHLGTYHADRQERAQAESYFRRYLRYWGDGEIDRNEVAAARAYLSR